MKLNELKYFAFDKQLLAIYSSVKHFRCLIEGREFDFLADHETIHQSIQSRRIPQTAQTLGSYLRDLNKHTSRKRNVVV